VNGRSRARAFLLGNFVDNRLAGLLVAKHF
jgi:hypothetical protein